MRTAHSCRNRNVSAFCLCVLLIAGTAPPGAGQSQAGDPSSATPKPDLLTLTVGKSLLVKCDLPIERIVVGFGDVAEASAPDPYEVMINGKTPGVTSLIIWQRGGTKLFFDVRVNASTFVTDNRVDAIRDQLELELPGQDISLSFENDNVFLRGTVKDVTSADRAVAIASTLGKTVNLLYVDVPAPEAQILLKVKFASVDRNASLQLGMNILSTGAANTIGAVSTGQFSAPAAPAVSPGTPIASTITDALNLFFFRPDLNLGATIQALQVKGLLQVLSEPNVLAQNGKQSSFLAGGEFPFPSVSAGGVGGTPAVAIQFREYGVRLSFTPTITPRGTIQLQVSPEVSALDFTNGLIVSGFNVPALTTRKMSTQVELSEGQSFAIGGLLDNRTTETLEKIPFISEIPILGKFFQSKSVSKQNTELIVIVTPELVRPIPVGQPLPALKFPAPFLPPNTSFDPRTPGLDATGPVPVDPPQPTMPIEKLMQSIRLAAVPVPPITGSVSSSAATPPEAAH